MPPSDNNQILQKKDFGQIATDLGVPIDKQDYFVEEAQDIGELFRCSKSTANNPREDHREFVKALKATLKSLQKAKSLIERQGVHCDLVLSSEFRATLGEIVNPPGVRSRLSTPPRVFERDFRDYWDRSKQDSMTEDVTPDALVGGEKAVFAQDPGRAFCDLLDLQCRMLERELLVWKQDLGGPDRMRVRTYFLGQLLALHNKVFGDTATSTPNGSFSNMCHLLFDSFGESTNGLDNAIKPLFAKQPTKAP